MNHHFKRRNFIKSAGLTSAGILAGGFSFALPQQNQYESKRPAPADRKFVSDAVEAKIKQVKKAIKDPELAWLFENCFPNTLDTTVRTGTLNGKPDTFVITGDIEAMWLRDSTAQVFPYLPLTKQDKKLKTMIAGVIHRQTKCILIDPYANAFNYEATGGHWQKDYTRMKLELHERKWEVDSLCYTIRLAYYYWKTTGDASVFDADWDKAMQLVVQTFKEQQRKENKGPYKFMRNTTNPKDSLAGYGYGNPVRPVGMICSMFRPSDDSTIFAFLVPSNLFAVTSLRQLVEIYETELKNKAFATQCRELADEVEQAIRQYAVKEHLNYGKVYAFETDGYGNYLHIDDANLPSLISLPYLNSVPENDPIYQNTRRFVLSQDNPYYYKGTAAEGVGSPHTAEGRIWPLSIIARALTSNNEQEIADALRMLKNTHAGTGFMHESFDKDDPSKFSRKWFAWANTLFGELILKVYDKYPHLLKA